MTDERAEQPLRVLTWNLWGRYGLCEERRRAIETTLSGLAPDVCALQEVWNSPREGSFAEYLAESLGMYSTQTAPSENDEGGAGNAIVSRWPVAETAELRLPAGSAADEGRTALFALVEHPLGQQPVYTTQLNSEPTASAIRCEQVEALCRFIASRRGGLLPIVTGDLNAEPDSDEVRLLQGHKTAPVVPGFALLDVWRYADPGDEGWTWSPRNPHAAATFDVGARIDYILSGFSGGRRRVRSVAVVADGPVDGVWPSDHAAVFAELRP